MCWRWILLPRTTASPIGLAYGAGRRILCVFIAHWVPLLRCGTRTKTSRTSFYLLTWKLRRTTPRTSSTWPPYSSMTRPIRLLAPLVVILNFLRLLNCGPSPQRSLFPSFQPCLWSTTSIHMSQAACTFPDWLWVFLLEVPD